jgi:hypothetical protein
LTDDLLDQVVERIVGWYVGGEKREFDITGKREKK